MFSNVIHSQITSTNARSNTIYLFGGAGTSNVIRKWNGSSDSVESAAATAAKYSQSGGVLNFNSYVFGGQKWNGSAWSSTNEIDKYDGTTYSNTGTSLATAINPGNTTSTGTYIYIFASKVYNDGQAVQRYTGSAISTVYTILSPYKSSAGTGMYNAESYLFGGYGSAGAQTTISKFTGAALSSVATSMTGNAYSFANNCATSYTDGAMAMFGSQASGNERTIWIYNPSGVYGFYAGVGANTFSTNTNTSAVASFRQVASGQGEKHFVFGGGNGIVYSMTSFRGSITTEADSLGASYSSGVATCITTNTSYTYS